MSTVNYNPSPRTTGFANAPLILGIAQLLVGPLTAIPAVFCGHTALSSMKQNPGIPGHGRALAGTILGYLGLVILGLLVLYILLRM